MFHEERAAAARDTALATTPPVQQVDPLLQLTVRHANSQFVDAVVGAIGRMRSALLRTIDLAEHQVVQSEARHCLDDLKAKVRRDADRTERQIIRAFTDFLDTTAALASSSEDRP